MVITIESVASFHFILCNNRLKHRIFTEDMVTGNINLWRTFYSVVVGDFRFYKLVVIAQFSHMGLISMIYIDICMFWCNKALPNSDDNMMPHIRKIVLCCA